MGGQLKLEEHTQGLPQWLRRVSGFGDSPQDLVFDSRLGKYPYSKWEAVTSVTALIPQTNERMPHRHIIELLVQFVVLLARLFAIVTKKSTQAQHLPKWPNIFITHTNIHMVLHIMHHQCV